MKKILYITLLNSGDKNGGFVYRKAIDNALSDIVGEENLDIVTSVLDDTKWSGNIVYRIKHYTSGKEKLLNLLSGNITQFSANDVRKVCELIKNKHYSTVVFGCSETGNLIKNVKRLGVKTITFYNDIIADAVKRKWKLEHKISYLPIALCERRAEKQNILYCDVKVALNKRDSDMMKHYWGQCADAVIPISLNDTYHDRICEKLNRQSPLKLLFIGSYGWSANKEGVIWFCENVMRKISKDIAVLYVVGDKMEKIANHPSVANMENVVVLGTVDDLSEEYAKADVVVAPILTGTGMKTKTAEALMHGKYILATREAIEGYIGLEDSLCISAADYIERIQKLFINRPKKFIKANRQLYLENYSVQAMVDKLCELI